MHKHLRFSHDIRLLRLELQLTLPVLAASAVAADPVQHLDLLGVLLVNVHFT